MWFGSQQWKINKGFFHYDHHFRSYLLEFFTFLSHNVSLLPKSHTELVKLGSKKKVRLKTPKKRFRLFKLEITKKRNYTNMNEFKSIWNRVCTLIKVRTAFPSGFFRSQCQVTFPINNILWNATSQSSVLLWVTFHVILFFSEKMLDRGAHTGAKEANNALRAICVCWG